jgi:hypothetical protein
MLDTARCTMLEHTEMSRTPCARSSSIARLYCCLWVSAKASASAYHSRSTLTTVSVVGCQGPGHWQACSSSASAACFLIDIGALSSSWNDVATTIRDSASFCTILLRTLSLSVQSRVIGLQAGLQYMKCSLNWAPLFATKQPAHTKLDLQSFLSVHQFRAHATLCKLQV